MEELRLAYWLVEVNNATDLYIVPRFTYLFYIRTTFRFRISTSPFLKFIIHQYFRFLCVE